MSIISTFIRGSLGVNRLLVAALLVGGASMTSAQTVTVRGAVEDVGPTFVMSCTPLTLVGAGVNLNAVLGQEVEAVGTVIGPNLLSISSVTPVTDVFEANKNAKVGGTLKLSVTGPAGRLEQFYFSLNSGFATAHAMGWFLGAAPLHLLAQGTIPATGKLEISIAIPNLPVLANLPMFFQDVRLPAGGGFVLGNADCITIQS